MMGATGDEHGWYVAVSYNHILVCFETFSIGVLLDFIVFDWYVRHKGIPT